MASKKKGMRTPTSLTPVNRRAAGIDIGATFHVVAVPHELDGEPVRSFRSFTAGLTRLADWLVGLGITTFAMESTGIYWVPLFEILEARGLEVVLVKGRARGHGQADGDLATGHLAGRAGVLPLDADRVVALLEEAGVIDAPGVDGLVLGQDAQSVVGGVGAHVLVAPGRGIQEVQEPMVVERAPLRTAVRGERSDGLDALALEVAQQAGSIHRERGAPLDPAQELAEALEVVGQGGLRNGGGERHA